MLILLAVNTNAWIRVGGLFLALFAVLFFIDRLFAWLAKNGAKAMRNDKSGGLMSNVLGTFDGFLRPEQQLVQEERDQRKAETKHADPRQPQTILSDSKLDS